MLYIVNRWLIHYTVKTEIQETDRLQKVVARLVATSPAGVNLLLIGGFRYRLLDNSQRFSVDIGYHWGGDLEAKQQELLALCRRVILGQVRRELGYEGSVSVRTGPDADSPNARFVDLRFWQGNTSLAFTRCFGVTSSSRCRRRSPASPTVAITGSPIASPRPAN